MHSQPNNNSSIQWIIDQHENTNHKYDDYLNYEFHLRMVAKAAKDFLHLVNEEEFSNHYNEKILSEREALFFTMDTLEIAAFGHDLIEDTRVSYNDVAQNLGIAAAEIIYAVTNEKGKSRKERANDKYYEGIRSTPGAVFIKLCDRIANVQYSKMTGSRMFEMYRKENNFFMEQLGWNPNEKDMHQYSNMFDYLINLFKP